MNYLSNKTPYFVIILSILTVVGCSDSNGVSNGSATLSGRVDGDQSRQKIAAPVDGAIVSVAAVQSDGTVRMLDGAEAETSASGTYTLSFDASAAEHFMVTATNNAVTWKGYLQSGVRNGAEYVLKPINSESTAEAEVFASLIASGKTTGVTKSDVEAMVSGRVASEINASASAASSFANAIYKSASARAEFYTREVQGDVEAKRVATLENLRNAQANLEANLNSSTSLEAYNSAYESYLDARLNAYTDAGVSMSNSARSVEMETRVFLNSLSNVSLEAKEAARAEASYVAALAIRKAVEAQVAASTMSESSQNRITQAGNTLMADIRTAVGVESEVEAAFQTYKDEVRSTMEEDASIEASVIVNIDTEINAESGPKAVLESGFSSLLSLEIAVSLYDSYYQAVQTTVENNVDGSVSSNMASIITDIMILINLQS